ncbi:YdcF family protein [Staphylococcus cohnii]|uniref:DUF218 domain-containing protein n=2 Tax=Staphylococcus TaxID=1279 RepID=A0A2T4LQS2_9STAP|nr:MULTISPECIES: YdcF family protein [Staphylococcus]MBA1353964.1 YdcF family protein [Staphylococcus cohnii]MBA1390337.1 YdcF family protein [Staphylococcus cohnii]MCE5032942.1 YdcF family protein [Staphylococcus cohnii]MCE5098641.1 YdcF family protein [Staphylococcus cohnii]MSU29677.1 YdcF family protein [Staphylococcus sp. McC-251-APC-3A2]
MYTLSLIISLFILCGFIAMYKNLKFTTNLTFFVIQIILGYIVIILHVGKSSLPIPLIITMFVGVLLLHIKHHHLFKHSVSTLFLRRLYAIAYKVLLFMIACAYISLIPVGINVIFYWLAAIAFSACFTFICYALCASAFSNVTYKQDFDVILVLGAGIFTEQVTPMLAKRLDKAITLYHLHPGAHIIVSGGQGPDEPISEALAMYRYLVQRNINPSAIILEDQSTSTYENLKYTKVLIQQLFKYEPNIICVTSQFHIMRALRFGQKLNLNLKGVGSHTPYHFFEIALIRDFLAIMYQYKLLLTCFFAVLFWACIMALWHIPTI